MPVGPGRQAPPRPPKRRKSRRWVSFCKFKGINMVNESFPVTWKVQSVSKRLKDVFNGGEIPMTPLSVNHALWHRADVAEEPIQLL